MRRGCIEKAGMPIGISALNFQRYRLYFIHVLDIIKVTWNVRQLLLF